MIDYFSRFLFSKVIESKETSKIREFIKLLSDKLKIKKLVSDSGKKFDNHEMKKLCRELEIDHELNTPFYHKSNGRIERANRTIRNSTKKKGAIKS